MYSDPEKKIWQRSLQIVVGIDTVLVACSAVMKRLT